MDAASILDDLNLNLTRTVKWNTKERITHHAVADGRTVDPLWDSLISRMLLKLGTINTAFWSMLSLTSVE
jgi:hypothetical protein